MQHFNEETVLIKQEIPEADSDQHLFNVDSKLISGVEEAQLLENSLDLKMDVKEEIIADSEDTKSDRRAGKASKSSRDTKSKRKRSNKSESQRKKIKESVSDKR